MHLIERAITGCSVDDACLPRRECYGFPIFLVTTYFHMRLHTGLMTCHYIVYLFFVCTAVASYCFEAAVSNLGLALIFLGFQVMFSLLCQGRVLAWHPPPRRTPLVLEHHRRDGGCEQAGENCTRSCGLGVRQVRRLLELSRPFHGPPVCW